MKPVNNSTERRPLGKPAAKEPVTPEKAARFRALLDKPNKHEQKKPRPSTLGKKKDDDAVDPAAMHPKMTPQPELRPIAIEKVEAPRPVIEPKIVEGLVREISVITEADRTDVRIQLNSKTLDGLQINISKENGNVSLQFFTTSP